MTTDSNSRKARRDLEKSGVLAVQTYLVANLVRQFPGSTSYELACLGNENRNMVARRLPDASKRGLVIKGCSREDIFTGRQCSTWWPHNEPQILEEITDASVDT